MSESPNSRIPAMTPAMTGTMKNNAPYAHGLSVCEYKRAVLSFVVDPGDTVALIMLDALGAEEFFGLVSAEAKLTQDIRRKINGHLTTIRQKSIDTLNKSIKKWQQKYLSWHDDLYERHLGSGGFLLTPEDRHWPDALNDLGINRPIALWGRGLRSIPSMGKVIAIVGSRQSSSYGQRVTADLSYELTESGYTIVSGGAFGIDACAHRSALAAARERHQDSKTIAVVAGGVDTYYPRQHERLYQEIIAHGSYLSEAPPGTRATKWRFLQRNRLIAALASAVCVTEARFRSGALSTAHHAFNLLRQVTTVPGSILLPNNAGCHHLIRKNMAVLITCAQDIKELVEPLDDVSADRYAKRFGSVDAVHDLREKNRPEDTMAVLPGFDNYSQEERRILKALGQDSPSTVNAIIAQTRLEPQLVLKTLAALSSREVLVHEGRGYKIKRNVRSQES